MKLFNKLWKKVLAGVIGTILFLGISLFVAGHVYYNNIFYATLDDWDIFKADTTGDYCYATQLFEDDVSITIAIVDTPVDTTEDITAGRFLIIQIANVLDYELSVEPFNVAVGFSDDNFDEQRPTQTMNGMARATATINAGVLGIVVGIPAEQSKDFWKMLQHSTLLIIKLSDGGLTFDVGNIRAVLIKSLECKAVTFDGETS